MTKNQLIIPVKQLPYVLLFDLNKQWLDLKQQRLELIEQMRELRTKGYNLTMEINKVEDGISKAIVRLEKKNV